MLYNLKTSEAESNEDDKGEPKTFFQKNVLDYKQIAKEEFKIPQLLMDREK
jgi:nitrite reductase/ring-hydroxylating ferredoxin subunit